MASETTFIIGVETYIENENGVFFREYATIDMCKLDFTTNVTKLPWKNKNPDKKRWYWYPPTGDGNTIVCKDCNGDYPQPVPIDDVISALAMDIITDNYRRLKWAHQLLTTIRKTEMRNENIKILFFGH